MRRRWTPARTFCVVTGAAFSMVAWACGGSDKPSQTAGPAGDGAPASVRVADVREQTRPVTATVAGVVEPLRRATPASRLTGTIVAAPFEEGDRVRAGQVLVRIDAQDMAARRAQTEAQAREAEAVLADAETNLARMRALYAQHAVARIQLEQAETGAARANAALATARAAQRELDAHFAYATIEAPFAGVVVRKFAQTGNLATPGQPLFVLEDISRARVVAAIGEDQAARLHEGDAVPVDVAGSGERVSGRVEAVLPPGDPAARGFRVHVLIDNPPRTLRSGMTAALRIPAMSADHSAAVLLVPADAIVRRGQLTSVFIVDGGIARLRWITVAEPEAGYVAVLSGLRPGERVVVGAERERLTDGQPVTVARAEGV